jgi:zinc and cadmium transporter
VSTLSWIIAVSLAGGVLSVLRPAALSMLSARIGQCADFLRHRRLLGAAFLEILPARAGARRSASVMAATVLFGILVFFVLEKLVLWRHCHHDHCEAHDAHAPGHDHGRSGLLILVGDTFHNFVDGILIAAAFLENTELGIVTALAIIAHEIPQEVGDYLILLHSGYSKPGAGLQPAVQPGDAGRRDAGLFRPVP